MEIIGKYFIYIAATMIFLLCYPLKEDVVLC